jgi:hypothetical protein
LAISANGDIMNAPSVRCKNQGIEDSEDLLELL